MNVEKIVHERRIVSKDEGCSSQDLIPTLEYHFNLIWRTCVVSPHSYLILGNGIAGITAAETLRAEDPHAEVTLVTDEATPAYYRPALKDYLAHQLQMEHLPARPQTFYQDRHLRVVTGRVVALHGEQHLVRLHTGQVLPYQRLLLATGARSASLSCPGKHLSGIITLRNLADYQELMRRLPHARHIVVCGSGSLGLETVEVLCKLGYSVTHVVRGQQLWSEVLDATASDLVLQQERHRGVQVHLREAIQEIIGGTDGQISALITTSGVQIPCDLLIAAIGIVSDCSWLKPCGVACRSGVLVDDQMRTSVHDVYAAGDLVETALPFQQRTRLLGLWYPAIQQARAAAYSMLDLLDLERPFRFDTCYHTTVLYGLECTAIGVTAHTHGIPGVQEIIAPAQTRIYRKLVLKQGVPVGYLGLGERGEALAFKRAIDAGVDLSPIVDAVFDPTFHLGTWLDQQGVSPAVLCVRKSDMVTRRLPQVPRMQE